MKIGMSNSEEEDNLFNVDQEASQKLRIQSTKLVIFCYENIIFGQAVFGFEKGCLGLRCPHTRSRVALEISSITLDRRDGQTEGLSHGISSFLSFYYKYKVLMKMVFRFEEKDKREQVVHVSVLSVWILRCSFKV
ncbi:hypothetical protein COJ16_28405 [Bacillus cereus]|uniref:hypothetical protein n=1 Tax=Bacillus cereus TaxID=1396 RepID=UPI000BF458CE|nr:hypothetical protein [Bacillus cereus]PFL28696.1 hypothetical protein COJ16_28405 [Bacillus cereus]